MAVVSLIAATTTATGSGTVSFGSMTNRYAILVDSAISLGPGFVPRFTVSWDGNVFVPTAPIGQFGNVFVFDVPALAVGMTFSGNPSGNYVAVSAYPLTD